MVQPIIVPHIDVADPTIDPRGILVRLRGECVDIYFQCPQLLSLWSFTLIVAPRTSGTRSTSFRWPWVGPAPRTRHSARVNHQWWAAIAEINVDGSIGI
jgi:hypothetical protein